MERAGSDGRMGIWIAAIVALLALLVVGLVLYFRMSVPLHEPAKHGGVPPAISFGAPRNDGGARRV